MGKDNTQRPMVKHFLPRWKEFQRIHGDEETVRRLSTGERVVKVSHKDRVGLLQALGLRKI